MQIPSLARALIKIFTMHIVTLAQKYCNSNSASGKGTLSSKLVSEYAMRQGNA